MLAECRILNLGDTARNIANHRITPLLGDVDLTHITRAEWTTLSGPGDTILLRLIEAIQHSLRRRKKSEESKDADEHRQASSIRIPCSSLRLIRNLLLQLTFAFSAFRAMAGEGYCGVRSERCKE